MKQQRIFLLVLVGVSIATVLWMRDSFLNKGTSDIQTASLPAQSSVNQQFAVETAPLAPPAQPAAAPASAPLPETNQAAVTEQASTSPAPAETVLPENLLSYIQFVSLIDNYNVQGGEISWRAYRQYRSSKTKSL
jgi:4-amino-4-deoxy-L-arabinose transferase-like glycosyltransferase